MENQLITLEATARILGRTTKTLQVRRSLQQKYEGINPPPVRTVVDSQGRVRRAYSVEDQIRWLHAVYPAYMTPEVEQKIREAAQ